MPGIERSRFKRQPVHPDYLCGLCGEVSWQPLQSTSCRHVFCSECITKWLSEESKNTGSDDGTCPIDSSSLSRNGLSEPPHELIQSLAVLEVKCDYFSNGCSTFIPLERLDKHSDHCLFNPNRSIRSKIETVLKAQKSLSSSYVKQLLKLLDEKEKIVNEQEGLINKILEEGSDLDQIVQEFTEEKIRFEKEKLNELEMLESIIRKLQDENGDLRERLSQIRQKFIQSNLIDVGKQLNGQQLFICSDASTSNSCESLSLSPRQVLSLTNNSLTTRATVEVSHTRNNSSSASPSHRILMKKLKNQLVEDTYNVSELLVK